MDFVQYTLKGSFVAFIEVIIFSIFFNGFFDRKRKDLKYYLILFVYLITLIVASYLNEYGLSFTIKVIILILVGTIIINNLYQASWKAILLYQGIYMLCSAISDSLAISILSIGHGSVYVNLFYENFFLSAQGAILSKTCNMIIVSVFIRRFGKDTNRYSISEVLIMLLQGISGIACLLMVIEFSYYKISTYKMPSLYLIAVSLLILASYIAFYNIFENYIKKRNIEQEAMKIQFYNKGQYDYYAALEEENITIRKMYHDIKNHLLAIQGLSNEHSDASETYLEKCLDAVAGYDEFFDTGNQLADIIFYEKCNAAKANNIKTNIIIQKNSLNHIEMLDLCAILTNSFDNAMEACKQCSGERYIKVKSVKNEAAVIITVKNNYEHEPNINEKGDLITSKKNKAKHGIGMQSLRMATSKYNGNVEISVDKEKKEFLLIIMIPIAYQNTV